MRLFKKGKIEEIPDDVAADIEYRELESNLFSLYPIGREFEYLGLKCRVTKHHPEIKVFSLPYSGVYVPGIDAYIACDYVDKNGVLHNIKFALSEIAAMSEGKK